jgi:L,D-peptidoglycan transpeptidase YkuD (ErfK/YbiS/YcfS/YnhG family)
MLNCRALCNRIDKVAAQGEKVSMVNIGSHKLGRSGKTLSHGFDTRERTLRRGAIRGNELSCGKPNRGRLLLTRLVVTGVARTDRNAAPRGRLRAGVCTMVCAIGGAGIRHVKREGDGATPAGRFACLGGFFNSQRAPRPQTLLPLRAIKRELGWCDDPQAPAYNRPLRLPSRFSHEDMWREDGLYDLVIVLDYNFSRRIKNRGSAIFLHCARPDFAPTAGCVALSPADWRRLLPRLSRHLVVIAQ